MARGCGEKHICKSKCTKHHIGGAILEVPMLQNGTPLWREAHLKVKMCKTPHSRSHFGRSDVQKWHAAVARSTFASQNAQNTTIPDPFWTFQCSKMARGCGTKHIRIPDPFWTFRCSKMARRCGAKHICKSKCGKHHTLGPLF